MGWGSWWAGGLAGWRVGGGWWAGGDGG